MGNFPQLERLLWFDAKIREGVWPNAVWIAKRFEVSNKTAKRTVECLRDRIGAPLDYVASKRGYRYEDDSWEFPRFPVSHEEILAILLAKKLLASSAGGFIGGAIEKFVQKWFLEANKAGFSEKAIRDGFSAVWHGHSPAGIKPFRTVSDALLKRRKLSFVYHSPGTDRTTERTAEPHHLQYYMASWVLIAWCEIRGEWRKFYLARMSRIRTSNQSFEPRPPKTWRHLIGKSFGIFQGENCKRVVLRFNSFRARWIKEQVWHPDQKIVFEESGDLVLSFPVADFREVSMKILQFGADVEVIEPEELREIIANEIEKMARMY